MMILLATCLLPLIAAVWEDLPDEDCYHCVRYVGTDVYFTAQGLVNNTLVVGGRNAVLKLDFENQIDENFPDRDVTGHSNIQDIAHNDYSNCLDAGRSQEMCANYYKVIIQIDARTVLLCGTSAYNPQCDFRQISDLSYAKRLDTVSGEGLCPADPNTSVTYTKTSPGVGFAGTCRSVCNEHAISRMNLQAGSLVATARTFKTDEVLSGADFVYSFEQGDFVYFLFKETALEEEREYVYSRVGRLCKNDVGSSSPFFKDYFKTFLKVRIYCTSNQPGEAPFDHNELGGAWFDDGILYTTFSGPKNLVSGSILCTYTLQDIEAAFKGKYKVHDFHTMKWLPRRNFKPVQCTSHPNITAAREIVLMHDPIYSLTPLYSYPSDRLSGLVGREFTAFGSTFYELFSSNAEGKVVRVTYDKANPHVIYDQTFKAADSEIISLLLDKDKIYALSQTSVTMVPSEYDCGKPKTCQSCISHHYPMCGWCYGQGTWSCTESHACTASWISPLSQCEEPPTFTSVPKNETFRENETAILACSARDNHPFFWTKPGGSIPRKSKIMDNGHLLIPVLRAVDEGCYRCNMNNTSGAVFAEACLSVIVAPAFTEKGKPQDTSIQVGYSNLLLPCSGTGSPKPISTWERIGSKLPEGSVVLEDGSLKLIRVMTIDAGQYKCTLENQEGTAHTFINLRVDSPTERYRTNGTEEQLNGNQMNKRTIITLIICVMVVVLCFVTGFVAFTFRRRRRKRRNNRHEYLENDNPLAMDSPLPIASTPLQALHNHWSNMAEEVPVTPLANAGLHGLVTLPEVEDEAPPAYTEHPHILRDMSSDYHLLSFPAQSQSTPSPVLYQPLAQHECNARHHECGARHNECGARHNECSARHNDYNAHPHEPNSHGQAGPRFITSLPDSSPNFLSTLPLSRESDEQYDVMPSQGGYNALSNDPPD